MGVNSLPKAIIRQRRDCDLNPGPSVPESNTLRLTITKKMKKVSGNKRVFTKNYTGIWEGRNRVL